MPGTLIMAENMVAMAVNPRSQASTATGQCLQRYLAATMQTLSLNVSTLWGRDKKAHINCKVLTLECTVI